LAELSGVAHHRVWVMVHDAGPLGLRAIYQRAALPEALYPAFRAAVDSVHTLHQEGADLDLPQFQERLMERFLTQNEGGSPEDVDYLLARLDGLARDARPRRRDVA
jgi:uncharacterized protein (DUF2336 family)